MSAVDKLRVIARLLGPEEVPEAATPDRLWDFFQRFRRLLASESAGDQALVDALARALYPESEDGARGPCYLCGRTYKEHIPSPWKCGYAAPHPPTSEVGQ